MISRTATECCSAPVPASSGRSGQRGGSVAARAAVLARRELEELEEARGLLVEVERAADAASAAGDSPTHTPLSGAEEPALGSPCSQQHDQRGLLHPVPRLLLARQSGQHQASMRMDLQPPPKQGLFTPIKRSYTLED